MTTPTDPKPDRDVELLALVDVRDTMMYDPDTPWTVETMANRYNNITAYIKVSVALTAMRLARAEERESKWVSVNDRLPEPYTTALCVDKDGEFVTAIFIPSKQNAYKYSWENKYGHDVIITHWQPLPEPPTAIIQTETKTK